MIKRLDHIGIIVKDVDKVSEMFKQMGFNVSQIHVLENKGLKIAHLSMGEQHIELIAYLDEASSFARDVMGDGKGLNHLAFEVEDLSEAIEWAAKMGKKLMEGFPTQGSKGKIAFFEPDVSDGILIEFCETV